MAKNQTKYKRTKAPKREQLRWCSKKFCEIVERGAGEMAKKKVDAASFLFTKVRECLKEADKYAAKKDATWTVVYINSAQKIAAALREIENEIG